MIEMFRYLTGILEKKEKERCLFQSQISDSNTDLRHCAAYFSDYFYHLQAVLVWQGGRLDCAVFAGRVPLRA